MKHDTTFRDGIEAALKAMAAILTRASTYAQEAHSCIRRSEQNLAIGTLIPVEDDLEKALTLYKAVMAMHRFKW